MHVSKNILRFVTYFFVLIITSFKFKTISYYSMLFERDMCVRLFISLCSRYFFRKRWKRLCRKTPLSKIISGTFYVGTLREEKKQF